MLTDQHRAILDFETTHQHWVYAAAKETTVLRLFGMTAVRYAQVLNALLLRPEAVEYAPVTARRLVRLQEARRVVRSGRDCQLSTGSQFLSQ